MNIEHGCCCLAAVAAIDVHQAQNSGSHTRDELFLYSQKCESTAMGSVRWETERVAGWSFVAVQYSSFDTPQSASHSDKDK
jgi:hypothetical protein